MQVAIDLIYPDGRRETSIREEREFTLGRDSAATIAVAEIAELADVQLLIVPRHDGVWVSDNDEAKVRALRAGKPVGSALVPWGAEIDVGSLTVRIRKHQAARRSHRSPALVVVVAIAGMVILAMILAPAPRSALATTKAKPPALFDEGARQCEDRRQPQERGVRLAFEAEAREQRYPFAALDGIRAVELYRAAAACLAEARLDVQATGAEAKARALQRRIEDEYRALVVTQQRSLRRSDMAGALLATVSLRALTLHRPGDYARWLTTIEGQLAQRVAKESKESKKTNKSKANKE